MYNSASVYCRPESSMSQRVFHNASIFSHVAWISRSVTGMTPRCGIADWISAQERSFPSLRPISASQDRFVFLSPRWQCSGPKGAPTNDTLPSPGLDPWAVVVVQGGF